LLAAALFASAESRPVPLAWQYALGRMAAEFTAIRACGLALAEDES
jgi:hypothetical protein